MYYIVACFERKSFIYYILKYDDVKLDTELASLCKLHWRNSEFNTHWFLLQMLEAMRNDIDNGLRFQNVNCLCCLRVSVRISDKRNENWYRLYQCCPRDQCGFFEWYIPLNMPLSYEEDFQQLQIELCVFQEELKAVHEMVQPIVKTKRMVKFMFVKWCLLCVAVALLLTMSTV